MQRLVRVGEGVRFNGEGGRLLVEVQGRVIAEGDMVSICEEDFVPGDVKKLYTPLQQLKSSKAELDSNYGTPDITIQRRSVSGERQCDAERKGNNFSGKYG